jgi:hypothetical protein
MNIFFIKYLKKIYKYYKIMKNFITHENYYKSF